MTIRTPSPLAAVTLLELLVVIAIIGVLLGLLLSAVQQVRASANYTQCQNNLKQIVLAAMTYESANGVFPPGINISPNSIDPNPQYNFPSPWCGPYTSCLAYLLPYVEQNNVYQQLYNFNPPGAGLPPGALFQLNGTCPAWAYGFGPWDFQDANVLPSQVNGTGSGYPPAINTNIPVYRCPADPGIRADYVIDAQMINTNGVYGWIPAFDYIQNIPRYGAELGRSNYLGVGGAYGMIVGAPTNIAVYAQYTGIYYTNSQTKATDILDGTSNTLAFGETLGGLSNNGSRYFEISWMGSGWLNTYLGLAPQYGPQNNDYFFGEFQSKHPNGMVNFAFADGSVHGISQSVNFNVFIYASGMADGTAYSASDLY